MANTDDNLSLPERFGKMVMDALRSDTAQAATDLADAITPYFPVIGTAANLLRAVKEVSSRMFINKLWRFLDAMSETSAEEREDFLNEMEDKPKTKARIGQSLVLMLEQFDEVEKANMLADALKALMKKDIDLPTFRNLAIAINRVRIGDLPTLHTFYNETSVLEQKNADSEVMQALALAHLAGINSGNATYGGGPAFKPNSLGAIFLKHINWRSSIEE